MEKFFYISDAAKEVNVESHVLRYWEEELKLPIKRNELGHRYYTLEDIDFFLKVKDLRGKGFQLKAVKTMMRDGKLHLWEKDEKIEMSDELRINEQEAPVDMENLRNKVAGLCKEQGAGQENRLVKGQGIAQEEEQGTGQENRLVKGQAIAQEEKQGAGQEEEQGMGIMILESRDLYSQEKEEKAKRIQSLLRQIIQETVRESSREICRDIKDSVLKELDYQFRIQEEKQDEREEQRLRRSEEYYRRMDELLRAKSGRDEEKGSIHKIFQVFPWKKQREKSE